MSRGRRKRGAEHSGWAPNVLAKNLPGTPAKLLFNRENYMQPDIAVGNHSFIMKILLQYTDRTVDIRNITC
jgi:hypothetical protein